MGSFPGERLAEGISRPAGNVGAGRQQPLRFPFSEHWAGVLGCGPSGLRGGVFLLLISVCALVFVPGRVGHKLGCPLKDNTA